MKRVLAIILVTFMTLTFFISNNFSYAADINNKALEAFLEQLSQVSKDNRELGASVLKMHLEDEEKGIDNLKRDLPVYLGEDYIKVIENKGYTLDDIKDSLDTLKTWDMKDRMKLVDYIKTADNAGIKDLINNAGKETNRDGTPTIGGNGGGAGSTPGNIDKDKPKDESKEEKLLEVKFKDIESHGNKDDIVFLAERGIIEGKTKETFDPDGDLTRAEFMALIYRVLGLEPNKEKEIPFTDVKANSWYYEYVKAAFENKIIEGKSLTIFAPNHKVTREEMVVIVMRILENKEITHTLETVGIDLAMFEDNSQISSWARDYMFNGVKYGIIHGRTENTLNPKDNATRGEASNIIRKLFDVVNNKENKN